MTEDIVVVAGATGGIGAALIAALRDDARYSHVVALSRRRPDRWTDDARRTWLPADLLDDATLAAAARRIAGLGTPTRVVVATGLLHAPGAAPEKALRALDAATLTRLFEVNATGPALIARHLLPLAPRDRASVFAALSARVGSLGDNALGGWYGYRASKAALNMLIRTAAIEHRRTHPLGVCVTLHPGTVATPLSQPFAGSGRELFTPPTAAGHILRVLDGLGPADSGGFYGWDGAPIPW
ncbi:SDR family NAD(P)-dependent oxidoreductase [Phenylobacterium sp.]|uniref:SDR family NAD(P)-dependent oxidoreductase n=1 Tax=Phenylobacterium sp. TaxID=1871053 RepID=UPI00286A69D9|nr:SDR family NAD(P)-dependent oxidoreductase [Phenylobacterium sp.]